MSGLWDKQLSPVGDIDPVGTGTRLNRIKRSSYSHELTMRRLRRSVPNFALLALAACSAAASSDSPPSAGERAAIADSVRQTIVSTYDLSKPDVVDRFMRLYADTGRVVSASGGFVTTSRDSLRRQIETFWTAVGQNMQGPTWTWGDMIIDVLSRNAVAVTASYTVPHHTPDGQPHMIGGAWTSVWTRRNGRWIIVQEHLSDLPRSVTAPMEAGMHHP
jgi:ketosteroid isomerase-like protein